MQKTTDMYSETLVQYWITIWLQLESESNW